MCSATFGLVFWFFKGLKMFRFTLVVGNCLDRFHYLKKENNEFIEIGSKGDPVATAVAISATARVFVQCSTCVIIEKKSSSGGYNFYRAVVSGKAYDINNIPIPFANLNLASLNRLP